MPGFVSGYARFAKPGVFVSHCPAMSCIFMRITYRHTRECRYWLVHGGSLRAGVRAQTQRGHGLHADVVIVNPIIRIDAFLVKRAAPGFVFAVSRQSGLLVRRPEEFDLLHGEQQGAKRLLTPLSPTVHSGVTSGRRTRGLTSRMP
jgi:hypothetical protein